MTKEFEPVLTDEILHFLYRNAAFQALEEQQQQQFLNRFLHEPQFQAMMEHAIVLEEAIAEVEATMPKIQDKDFLFSPAQQKQLLKEQPAVSENVLYFPFDRHLPEYSPMVVLMQQSESTAAFEAMCKGMLMPLFHLCAQQQRDLVLIPFNQTAGNPLVFRNGALHLEQFGPFLQHAFTGEAYIMPALCKAMTVFQHDAKNKQRELIVLTDNRFSDFSAVLEQQADIRFGALHVDVSVIAMSESHFDKQPLFFADRVFFAQP